MSSIRISQRRSWRPSVIGVVGCASLVLASACGASDSGSGEALGRSESALVNTGLLPYPVVVVNGTVQTDTNGRPISAWDGTLVDLIAADAYAQCAANTATTAGQVSDRFLQRLSAKMTPARCTGAVKPATSDFAITDANSLAGWWATQRLDPHCNADPSTGQPKPIRLTNAKRHVIPDAIDPVSARLAEARAEVNFAEANLCIAQRMREVVSTGDGLTLSAADQRQVLETIRERSQLAMLQYSALGSIFASTQVPLPALPATPSPTFYTQIIPTLQAWAHSSDPNDATAMSELGVDFVNAVQLHSVASQELADLLWRSASAFLARGGPNVSQPDDAWGPASWRQRMMALLYGGDPLVQPRKTEPAAPWTHFDLGTEPGDPRTGLFGLVAGTTAWPNDRTRANTAADPGWVAASGASPEVTALLALARGADKLNLKIAVPATPAAAKGDVDRDASAKQLYNAVEAWLDLATCTAGNPIGCTYDAQIAALAGRDPNAGYDDYKLWKERRIRPSHAAVLVAQLADAIPKATVTSGAVTTTAPSFVGALRVVGSHSLVTGTTLGGGATGDWYHLDPASTLATLDNVDRAPLYTRYSSYRGVTAGAVNPAFQAHNNGLIGHMASMEPARIQGAVGALATARDNLRSSIMQKPLATAATSFFDRAEAVLNVVDASIGSNSVVIQPALEPRVGRVDEQGGQSRALDGCTPRSLSVTCTLPVQTTDATNTTVRWDVGITLPAGTDFTSGATLVVVPGGSLLSTIVSPPVAGAPTTFTGKTFAAVRAAAWTSATPVETKTTPTSTVTKQLTHQRFQVDLPVAPSAKYSLLLEKGTGATTKYMLLGEDVELKTLVGLLKSTAAPVPVFHPVETQYLAFDGALGGMARRAWASLAGSWSEPAYDGFGFGLHWVPPQDPQLFGGSAGDDATVFYLRSAKQAAADATNAVKGAIEELLKEQADDATLAAAQRRAAEIGQIEQRSLCGDSNPQCDTTTVKASPSIADYAAGCVAAAPSLLSTIDDIVSGGATARQAYADSYLDVCKKLEQSTKDALRASSGDFSLAKAVVDARAAQSPPDFAAYRGGALQSIYLDQWVALKHVENQGKALKTASQAAWSRVSEAYKLQSFKHYKTAMACTRDIVIGAVSGLSVSVGITPSVSFSPGPLLHAMADCQDALTQEGMVGDAPVMSAVTEAVSQLSAAAMAYSDSVGALQTSSVHGSQAIEQASLAKARANLDASLAGDALLTKFSTYRRYHSYEMWRAKALLENARRYAVSARRAVESRYLVDLSTANSAEPFVAAPSTWADEIYEYDLDAPSSVGLSTAPGDSGGLYPNRISDYVGNLERFVNGYPIARPTSIAKRDDGVIAIGGPDERRPGSPGATPTLTSDARRWRFLCPDGTWVGRVTTLAETSLPPVEKAFSNICPGARPTRARFVFTLDPWGRLEGDVANEPFEKRHNVRWGRLAVNLVGTAIRVCSESTNPANCYAEPYLPVDIVHTGPSWARAYDQTWHVLDVGVGSIESGKGLSAEEWLDPVTNGWGKPFVESVARTEFVERPFGGAYSVEIALTPGTHAERIEHVQVLYESTYWVSQK